MLIAAEVAEITIMARSMRALLSIATLLGLLLCPVSASADDTPTPACWMAAAVNSSTVQWGRLVLKDGLVTFHTAQGDWQTPLSEIKRIVRVKHAKQTFEIVTASGATLHLTILGAQMLPEPPQKAMQIIQRAVREVPSPVVTVTTTFGTVRQ